MALQEGTKLVPEKEDRRKSFRERLFFLESWFREEVFDK